MLPSTIAVLRQLRLTRFRTLRVASAELWQPRIPSCSNPTRRGATLDSTWRRWSGGGVVECGEASHLRDERAAVCRQRTALGLDGCREAEQEDGAHHPRVAVG